MSILQELYAQGGDEVILHTVELSCEAWPEPIVLIRDFVDHTIGTEDYRTLNAAASGMSIALPKRDNTTAQRLTFALDGVRQEATILIRRALAEHKKIRLTYRVYLSSDLNWPAENPHHFEVHAVKASANRVEVTAGLFDLIDMKWPRDVFNSENAPGLRFIS